MTMDTSTAGRDYGRHEQSCTARNPPTRTVAYQTSGADAPGPTTIYRLRADGTRTTLGCDTYGWGYAGQGPHRLARAILSDRLPERVVTTGLIHALAWDVIARLDRDGALCLPVDDVAAWLERDGAQLAEVA